jgi:hypothetical protein
MVVPSELDSLPQSSLLSLLEPLSQSSPLLVLLLESLLLEPLSQSSPPLVLLPGSLLLEPLSQSSPSEAAVSLESAVPLHEQPPGST